MNSFRKSVEKFSHYGPILLATSTGVFFAAWVLFGGYSAIEGTTINARFHLRNRLFPWKRPPEDIVFIDINDAALEANLREETRVPQRWPWPRSQWAVLHEFFRDLDIHPKAVVYDLIFDLADDSPVAESPGYTIRGLREDPQITCDQYFQAAMESTPDVPTFLAALFRPQSKKTFTREDYRKRYDAMEQFQWVPPPESFTRFGIPYRPEVHGSVFHAREVRIPWDSEWWARFSKMSAEEYETLEFMGMTASLLKPAAGSGMTTMDPEPDGITRWAPLFIEYDGILYPSLPLQVVFHLFETTLNEVRFEPGYVVVPRRGTGTVRIPVDGWKRLLLNFRYDRTSDEDRDVRGFETVNYWRVIDGFVALREGRTPRFDPRSFDGKVVIVGSSAEGTFDLRPVPISKRYPAVGTIGTIIRSIRQEDFLRPAPPVVDALWIIGGSFLVGLLGQFFTPVKHAFATLLLAVAHGFSSFFLFSHAGVIVNFFHVSLSEIVAYAVVTISQYLQVSSLFGRYITPEVRRYLMSNASALELGGQETEVSILFSDLKGFTSMSEKMEAKEVISCLNEYFGPMFRIIIDESHGTLDKLIGDAIMAYFGHPKPTPTHPVDAVSAALKMQKKLAELREQWAREGKPPIRMRIGVNTGSVVAGNMGDAGRTDYSIIGDNVNLASRLESNAPVDGVLISESTYRRVKDHFFFRERDPIKVKGKEKPVKVYEVIDFK